MNKFIKCEVQAKYGFDVDNCTQDDFLKVEEIIVSDVTMNHEYGEWDFSSFPNIKKIDCSFNPIDKLIVTSNSLLEEIRWEGARGNIGQLDFSFNPHLKKVKGGQDGLVELDLSFNTEIETIELFLNSYFRWLNVDKCMNLKRIDLTGVNIPFIDLTHCSNLEYVNINYLNLYKQRRDEYGPGYPRPFIFVRSDFDDEVIPKETRELRDYTYILVRTAPNSKEVRILNTLKNQKDEIVSIPHDRYGENVAIKHYEILELLD